MVYDSSLLPSWPDEENPGADCMESLKHYSKNVALKLSVLCRYILSTILFNLISEYCRSIPQYLRSFFEIFSTFV